MTLLLNPTSFPIQLITFLFFIGFPTFFLRFKLELPTKEQLKKQTKEIISLHCISLMICFNFKFLTKMTRNWQKKIATINKKRQSNEKFKKIRLDHVEISCSATTSIVDI